jgi:hypothetical protein
MNKAAKAAGHPRSVWQDGEINQRTKGVRWHDAIAKANDGGVAVAQLLPGYGAGIPWRREAVCEVFRQIAGTVGTRAHPAVFTASTE